MLSDIDEPQLIWPIGGEHTVHEPGIIKMGLRPPLETTPEQAAQNSTGADTPVHTVLVGQRPNR